MKKKIICIIMALILCATCLTVFASCDNVNKAASGIYYYYYQNRYDKKKYIELKADGTFIKIDGDFQANGTYAIKNGNITMDFDTENDENSIEGYVDAGVIGYDASTKLFYCKEGVKPSDNATNYPDATKYIVKNGEASLFYYFGKDTELTIPASVLINGKEYPVTGISQYAFINNKSVKTLKLPQSIKQIHKFAIMFGSISDVTLPFYVNDFVFPIELKSLTIESGIIGELEISNVNKIILGDGATEIVKSAFMGCFKLTDMVIGNNVKTIGDYAFYDCALLTQIIIPSSVQNMGKNIIPYTLDDVWVENTAMPNGWSNDWDSNINNSKIHWGDTWEYVNAKPALKVA